MCHRSNAHYRVDELSFLFLGGEEGLSWDTSTNDESYSKNVFAIDHFRLGPF